MAPKMNKVRQTPVLHDKSALILPHKDTSEEENEEGDQVRKEVALDPVMYLRRFVSSDNISHYLFFLSNYHTNPPWLNALVLRFFDRIVKEGLIRMFHEVPATYLRPLH